MSNIETLIAVEQHGYAIFGIGQTDAEAIADAAQWIDADTNLANIGRNPRPADGEMRLIEITAALAAQVRSQGGSFAYGTLPDGTACTVDEEDAAYA